MNTNELNQRLVARIEELIASLHVNETTLSQLIGVSQATFNRQMSLKSSISMDTLYAILNKYSNVSAEWLLRGEGPMYKDGSGETVTPEEVDERVPEKEVLLVPAGARGGSLEHFEEQVGLNAYNSEVIRSPFINADFAWMVKDDSMAPDYPAGTVLFVKGLKTSVIKWGNCYIFDTDDGFQFARLRRSQLGDDYMHCVPLNTEDYEPYDVAKADIHGIYKVLGAMRW